MDGSPEWTVERWRLAPGQEAAVEEAFGALGFTGYAIASRHDGGADLELYAAGPVPAAVADALGALGATRAESGTRAERDLLAAYADDQPCELAPGVWIDPGATLAAGPDRLVLRVPPLAAFGDGRHPTTRVAARLLADVPLAGARVLDLGCGTGVLGILAARRGAASVAFADIDADAVRATGACCALNGVEGAVAQGDLLDAVAAEPVSVLIANLYADVLLRLAADPRLDAVLPHGDLVIAGISAPRREAVAAAFAARGFRGRARDEEAWWCGMRMTR